VEHSLLVRLDRGEGAALPLAEPPLLADDARAREVAKTKGLLREGAHRQVVVAEHAGGFITKVLGGELGP